MIPPRLFSARSWAALEGVRRWTPWARAVPGPGRLFPVHAPSRLLLVGCAHRAKHQEPSGKKLLSEKKLVSHCPEGMCPSGGRGRCHLVLLVLTLLSGGASTLAVSETKACGFRVLCQPTRSGPGGAQRAQIGD